MTMGLTFTPSVTTVRRVNERRGGKRQHPPAEVRFWSRVNLLTDNECWLWIGAISTEAGKTVYGSFTLDGKIVRPHRVAYEWLVGPIPGIKLDHRCRNKLCVNPDHLRPATHKQNGENRGLDSNNTSGVRGVSWNVKAKRWIASVKHNGTNVYVGSFAGIEDAETAVIAKRLELFTHNELDRIERMSA